MNNRLLFCISFLTVSILSPAQPPSIGYYSTTGEWVNSTFIYLHRFTKTVHNSLSPTGQTSLIPATVPNTGTTIAGGADRQATSLSSPVAASQAKFLGVQGMGIDAAGQIYYSEGYSDVRLYNRDNNTVSLHAGIAGINDFVNGSASTARFRFVYGIDYNTVTARLAVADKDNHAIRSVNKLSAGAADVTTIAGNGTAGFLDGAGNAARFNEPIAVAVDANGITYVADSKNHAIRKISADGTVSTIAGNGTPGFSNGSGATARFNTPVALDIDNATGDLYVADRENMAIRKIDPNGNVTTFAINGSGLNTFKPIGIALDDAARNVYVISEAASHINRIASDGTQTVIVSTISSPCNSFIAGGVGAAMCFQYPKSILIDPRRNTYGTPALAAADLYIGDAYGIRKVELGGYEISPALPAGLLFDQTSGTLQGSPTTLMSKTLFTVTTTSLRGTGTTSFYLQVDDVAPTSLSYQTPQVFTRHTSITPIAPSSSGGTVTGYSVSPSLPSGLSLNVSTGVISGTPTTITTQADYTITATNSGGSTTTTITITVNDAPPIGLTYTTSNVFTKNTTISNLSPTSGGGAVLNYSITPALPSGLSINTSNGVISGTPTAIATATSYTITATNSGGSTSSTISITVNDIPPTALSYPTPTTFSKNNTITSLSPTVTGGGPITSFTSSPALPAGLTLHPTSGVISGTPTAISAATNYLITASNSGGSTSATVTIRVNDLPPGGLSYSTPNVFTRGSSIASLHPTLTGGGAVTGYAVTPALPAGLSLHSSTGILSGTPSLPSVQTTYTITASNSGGTSVAYIVITINDIPPANTIAAPSISYASPQRMPYNQAISPISPQNTGGAVQDVDTVLAGAHQTTGSADGSSTVARFNYGNTTDLAVDAAGNVYVNDIQNVSIRVIDPNGNVTTRTNGLVAPIAMTADKDGNVYVIDEDATYDQQVASTNALTIKKIFTNGTITDIGYYDGADGYEFIRTDHLGNVFLINYSTANFALYQQTGFNSFTLVHYGGIDYQLLDNGQLYLIDGNGNFVSMDLQGNATTIATGIDEIVNVDQAGTAIVWISGQLYRIDANRNKIALPTTMGYKPRLASYDNRNFFYPENSQVKKYAPGYFYILPALPSGLSLNESSGIISGTPAVLSNLTTYTVMATNSTGSSSTTIDVEVQSTLPVTGLKFSAISVAKGVQLEWSTTSEYQSRDFDIQRSVEGRTWIVIGTVPAVGNSTVEKRYQYVDEKIVGETAYYRLRQRDQDGTTHYSNILRVTIKSRSEDLLIYPNPATNMLHISLSKTQRAALIDAHGAVVWKGLLQAGRNDINVSTFPSGYYWLRTEIDHRKILLQ